MKTSKKILRKILITTGPTREPLDPVRYITNHSTGLIGYELAREAEKRGHEVCLISGPTCLEMRTKSPVIRTETAYQMQKEVMKKINEVDCIIMAAAVCDYRPEKIKKEKLKKTDKITLQLVKTPDILEKIKKKKGLLKIGFALETNDAVINASKKLKRKNLDIIVLNIKTKRNVPWGEGKKKYLIMDKNGKIDKFDNINKKGISRIILDKMEQAGLYEL